MTDAQRKRAESRQRRRSQDDDAPDEPEASTDGGEEPLHAVKQAAKVAAAVGAAGAAAAAARALTSHAEEEETDGSEPEEPQDESEEPQQEEEQEQEPEPEPKPEPQQEQPAEEPVAGAGLSEARKASDRAREQLQDLLDRPVESVSSLERTHDGWVAQLEVVELKRIPESTDVLASYEMELDDELNLRRYQKVRRYTRSQVDRGEG